MQAPQISNFSLDEKFRVEVINHGLDPNDIWIDRYLPIIWEKDRYYIEAFLGDIHGKIGLELGCNVGATAIMLSQLGARVTAVDVDKRYVTIAERNAARYGVEEIQFRWVPAGAELPFPAGSFDFVTCASVLEYASPQHIPALVREVDRVLVAGGVLLVLGTSNRLAPREVHSRAWFSNYIPRKWDTVLQPRQRGILPWQITRMLAGYADLVANNRGRYFEVRKRTGDGPKKIIALRMMAIGARLLGLSCGAITPSFFLALKKADLQTN